MNYDTWIRFYDTKHWTRSFLWIRYAWEGSYIPSKSWKQAKFEDKSSSWSSWNEEKMVRLRFQFEHSPSALTVSWPSVVWFDWGEYIESRLRTDIRVLLLQRTLSQEQQSPLCPHEAGTSEFASSNEDLMRIRAILSLTLQPLATGMWKMNCKTQRTQSMVTIGK